MKKTIFKKIVDLCEKESSFEWKKCRQSEINKWNKIYPVQMSDRFLRAGAFLKTWGVNNSTPLLSIFWQLNDLTKKRKHEKFYKSKELSILLSVIHYSF